MGGGLCQFGQKWGRRYLVFHIDVFRVYFPLWLCILFEMKFLPFNSLSADPALKPASGGSVIFSVFVAIAMVGVLGAVSVNILKGPVRTMSEVTRRTVAENHMVAAGKLTLVASANETGDCDRDGLIEPLEWQDAGGLPAPLNGGFLPANTGAALNDPWGNRYGYCSWDHGSYRHDSTCGMNPRRLMGANRESNIVIAVISSGPDRIFQTSCHAEGAANYIGRVAGSDDIVLGYTYAEARTMAGSLWNLKEGDSQTAEIRKNLSVTDEDGDEQLTFNAQTKQFQLGVGGTGMLPNIRTDYIQSLTMNAPVEFLNTIKGAEAVIMTDTAHAVAAIATASGNAGIGLKASGVAKAIESNGLLDMTGHKVINAAAPSDDTDVATKKYVDDKVSGEKRVKCEAFVFSGCDGGTTVSLDRTNLGSCKKACEEAGARCCHARFATTANNPHATLGNCTGHINGGASGSLANLLLGLLFPANVAAYCYEQY